MSTDNKKIEKSLFLFLITFSLSVGIFSNYRDLWLSANMLNANTIARIISIASIITVLIFFFFTIKVSYKKLRFGVLIALILKMLCSAILICLNNSGLLFLIKFIMFFDIAFNDLILSSIYPLMISINKSNESYTKKSTFEEVSNKIGFLIASLIIGRCIGKFTFTYNTCLLISVILIFISFIILLNIKEDCNNDKDRKLDLKEAFHYFNNHKIIYLFLVTDILSSVVWKGILGMPLLTLTSTLGFSTKGASFLVLGLGILSNILAMLVVKKLHFKNNHLNMIFKYGLRLILYLSVFITNNKVIFLITLIYLLILDMPFGFMLDDYFINKVSEEYSFLMTSVKYCTTIFGNAIGVFICGLVFNLKIRYLVLPSLIVGTLHYILTTILLLKREKVEY